MQSRLGGSDLNKFDAENRLGGAMTKQTFWHWFLPHTISKTKQGRTQICYLIITPWLKTDIFNKFD